MTEQKKWKPEPTQKKRGGHRKAKRVGKFNFRKMENSTNQVSVKTGEWVLTFLITAIPLVGFIMLFVWAFGSGTNESKTNWAKAALIWFAIIIGIYALFALIFGAVLLSALS